ncbi:MarR family winged helix-turn-helix transcriptional regulator [Amycolatopsis anabasis]|uniref:MarR family winged helix-turn-helix transcriptional regulator n=1 Tax=Amycolatopsis anabasis TaxID=1840409 RepID=UPI00131BE06C|nr:MarR family transcriptional regulator [Amycolatopsis anabasis]
MAPPKRTTAPPDEGTRTKAELDLADQLGHELVRFVRLINRAKSQVAKQGPDGIERSAYAILFCLIYDGPQRTSRLAESLHAEISTISRQSSTLVQHGLVERQADPEDGRACLLAPTAEGLRVFEENRKQRNQWLAEVLADWPEEDRQTLNALFARLNAGIEAHAPQLADAVQPQTTPRTPNKGAHA